MSLSSEFNAMAPELAGADQRRPKQLLDLPVDILKDIVKEVTHTNDLTSLALCHSALHALAIPHIYSRFDIVWPDSAASPEPRTGVDALTYGLGTLVMAPEVFGSRRNLSLDQRARRCRGNYYAQSTRKFSIGNGPPEWTQDYQITKEGGKMLGTLVALAVARMRNLESFVWDMPTGVLAAVFDALGSLDDHDDGIACRLDCVAVRWHNNLADRRLAPNHATRRRSDASPPLRVLNHVEHPSFSILPPLKSLSVLDIDEVQYLDEMSVLIRRSHNKLRELRVGIALHATSRDFVLVWNGENIQQIDKTNPEASSVTIGEKRLGGILGILTGLIIDLRGIHSQSLPPNRLRRRSNATFGTQQPPGGTDGLGASSESPLADPVVSGDTTGLANAASGSMTQEPVEQETNENPLSEIEHVRVAPKSSLSDSLSTNSPNDIETLFGHAPLPAPPSLNASTSHPSSGKAKDRSRRPEKLALEVLELEHVPLSIHVLHNTINWEKLTTLTLLRCPNHEQLWKVLRHVYSPKDSLSKQLYVSAPYHTSHKLPQKPSGSSLHFKLNLRKIYTDTVSSALISFIRDTLAPNSLESIFLLNASSYATSVSVDAIFRGVLRRHRNSLKQVLLDSGERGAESLPEANTYWRRWMLNREILKFIASGKMPALRELGAALDYRDWHYFLQHLPQMPQLRALYIPFLVNFTHGSLADTRELALQIVDIVALRPEIELCYVGIVKKCFEIQERQRGQDGTGHNVNGSHVHADISGSEEEDADDDGDDEDDDDGEDGSSNEGHDYHEDDESQDSDSGETDSDYDSDSDDNESDFEKGAARLRLREILYYDDKVGVFKARHGRL